jgi:hypothetical protein
MKNILHTKVVGRIKKYLELRLENKMLRKKIRELPTQDEYIKKIRELEIEIRLLKLENKNLKKNK